MKTQKLSANVKFTEQPKQRYPGDRKWKNEDAPKKEKSSYLSSAIKTYS